MASSCLVGFHLIAEFAHYGWEFYCGKKEKNVLDDILSHRKASQKTEMLADIQNELLNVHRHLDELAHLARESDSSDSTEDMENKQA